MTKIIFKVLPDGNVKFEIKGIKGKKCIDFTKDFEEAIGEVVQRYYTSEFYQTESEISLEDTREKRKLEEK
jgi:hypothetical protein